MIIAKTRSGYPIHYGEYETIEGFIEEILNQSFSDQFDTYCIAQWSHIRMRKREGLNGDSTLWWDLVIRRLEDTLNKYSLQEEKELLSIETSLNMVSHGRNLSVGIWKTW